MGKKYKKYKNFLEKFLDSNQGKRFFNIAYNVGAAIVIFGALAKILHWGFGDEMLMIGMLTEVVVFIISSFEKPSKDYKWEEVYPVLAESEDFVPREQRTQQTQQADVSRPAVQSTVTPSDGSSRSSGASSTQEGGNNIAANTGGSSGGSGSVFVGGGSSSSGNAGSGMQSGGSYGSSGGGISGGGSGTIIVGGATGTGNINADSGRATAGDNVSGGGSGPVIIGGGGVSSGSGFMGTSDGDVEKLSQMTENLEKFAKVTESLAAISDSLQKSFSVILEKSDGLGNNTQGYITQMESLNRNIAGLNTIYEVQLKGISGQISTIEHINAGLDRIKRLYDGSLADSSIFKNETEKMAQQLSELNRVYARLLQAMTTNMNMGGGFNPTSGNPPSL